ncbi:MAG: glycosyltransferase family 2 protein [Candidatus Aminicenantes bacterium]|nr:glycosyltransferase family 2 protein [Candidatus Aminicenantes bacterium]
MEAGTDKMKISAVIITLNEEERLPDALASLRGIVDEIVVVDSYSTDRTPEISRQAGVTFYQNRFDDYGQQKNFAMHKAEHEWILNLDADERVSPELKKAMMELKAQKPPENIAAFSITRKAFYLGRWIRHSGWYPDRKIRLFRKSKSSWQGRIHERLHVTGLVAPLPGVILHYTYRDINDHIRRLNHYSNFQSEEIIRQRKKCLFLRLLILPPVTFLRHYIWRLGFLDGFAGLVIAVVSSWGTAMKYFKAIAGKRTAEP